MKRLLTAALLGILLTGCTDIPPAAPTPSASQTSSGEDAVVAALGCEPTGMADAATFEGATEQEANAAYKAANDGARLVLFANYGERPQAQQAQSSTGTSTYVDENAAATYLVFRGNVGVGTMSVYPKADAGYYAVTTAVCP